MCIYIGSDAGFYSTIHDLAVHTNLQVHSIMLVTSRDKHRLGNRIWTDISSAQSNDLSAHCYTLSAVEPLYAVMCILCTGSKVQLASLTLYYYLFHTVTCTIVICPMYIFRSRELVCALTLSVE